MPTLTKTDTLSRELPHTLEVERGIAIRLYLWAYSASTRSITTCKMFWAFVFMPLVLPIVAFGKGAYTLFEWAEDRLIDILPEPKERPYVPPKPKPIKEGPSRSERILEAVSNFMARTWFYLQPLLKWGGIIIGVLIALVALYLIVNNASVIGVFMLKVLLYGIAIAAGSAGIVGVIFYLDTSDRFRGFCRLMSNLFHSVHTHTCANVKIKDAEAQPIEPTWID